MKEIGIIVSVVSLEVLFIGLILVKGIVYKVGKGKHANGTFPIVVRHPLTWRIVFIIGVLFFTIALILGLLMDDGGLEALILLVFIIPALVGVSWSFGWRLEVYKDKMIFRGMLWRKKIINYETISVVNRGTGVRVYKPKKFAFEATIWHENYEELYAFLDSRVMIKPFIRKKYMK